MRIGSRIVFVPMAFLATVSCKPRAFNEGASDLAVGAQSGSLDVEKGGTCVDKNYAVDFCKALQVIPNCEKNFHGRGKCPTMDEVFSGTIPAEQLKAEGGNESLDETGVGARDGSGKFFYKYFPGSPTDALTAEQKSQLGIKASMTLPENENLAPSAQVKQAAQVCRWAASMENMRHCMWNSIRRNHIQALSNGIWDTSAESNQAGIVFHGGFLKLDHNFCVASQSAMLYMSGATKGANGPRTLAEIGTPGLKTKLESFGWKQAKCADARPGDVVFATIDRKLGIWAHAWMFYGWNRQPLSNNAQFMNEFFSHAANDMETNANSLGQKHKRYGLAIDNNRGAVRVKYYRPLVQDQVKPIGDENTDGRNGCALIMRGPTAPSASSVASLMNEFGVNVNSLPDDRGTFVTQNGKQIGNNPIGTVSGGGGGGGSTPTTGSATAKDNPSDGVKGGHLRAEPSSLSQLSGKYVCLVKPNSVVKFKDGAGSGDFMKITVTGAPSECAGAAGKALYIYKRHFNIK